MSITIIQPNIKIKDNINIEGFSLSIEGNKLFDDTNLYINNTKYGLIGKNGTGKSTLLRALYDKKFKINENISIFYVEQEILNSNISAVQAVLQADLKNLELLKIEQELLTRLDDDENDEDNNLLEELNKISNELSLNDIDLLEPKARKILYGLGFNSEMQDRNVNKFSGGWQMRISLARGLFMNPKVLLLDEPTNHLDLNAVIWLTNYLSQWKNSLIIISHDQYFLNNVCDNIILLENKKLLYYNCIYDKYKKMYYQNKKKEILRWEKYQKKIKNLKKKGKYDKKKDKEYRIVKNDNGNILISRPEKEYKVVFNFNDAYNIKGNIIEMKNITFGYNENILFENVNFGVNINSRIVIVGENGIGKSTFMKLLINKLEACNGEIIINSKSRIGVYNQHFMDSLPLDNNSIDYLLELSENKLKYQEVRNLLGKFGLKGKSQILEMNKLSGGQKARVVFTSLYIINPNMIFLDEPTNNLDIESVEALIDAINNYEGGIVIITHDIKLIDQTECDIYICKDKNINKFDGDIDDYQKLFLCE